MICHLTSQFSNGNFPLLEEWEIRNEFNICKADSRIFSISPQSHSTSPPSLQTFRMTRPRISTKRRNTAVLQSNDLQNSARLCSEAGKGEREKRPSLTFAKLVRLASLKDSVVA